MTIQQQINVSVNGQTEIEEGSLYCDFSSSSFVNHATITLPYRDWKWELWSQEGAEVIIQAGTVNLGTVFHGTINHPIKEEKYITVELIDFGQNFQKYYPGIYQAERLEDILTEMCAECDYTADLSAVPPSILESIISRSGTIEYGDVSSNSASAQVAETVSTICGEFECTIPACQGEYSNQFYTTCAQNQCTYCGKYNTLTVDNSIHNCQYLCINCKAIYDGITGKQSNMDELAQLTLTYGPEAGSNFSSMPGAATGSATYEQEIRAICQNNNLYIYLTQNNKAIFKEFKGTPLPDAIINIGQIEYKSYQFIDSANKQLQPVTVNYNGGSITATDDEETSTSPIILNHPEMDQNAANILAQQTLNEELETLVNETYLTILLDSIISVGTWVQVPDVHTPQLQSTSQVFYIDSMKIAIEAEKAQRAILTLKYSPSLLQNYNVTIPPSTPPTFDQIMREAATFQYSSLCQTYECTDSKRVCDCEGMSNWLYTELSQIGIQVQIISFDSPYLATSNFYCVQQNKGNQWYDLPYSEYSFSGLFIPSGIRTNLRVVNGD